LRCQLTSSPAVRVGPAAAVDEVAKKIPEKIRDFVSIIFMGLEFKADTYF
jgi:hypothetical protein